MCVYIYIYIYIHIITYTHCAHHPSTIVGQKPVVAAGYITCDYTTHSMARACKPDDWLDKSDTHFFGGTSKKRHCVSS